MVVQYYCIVRLCNTIIADIDWSVSAFIDIDLSVSAFISHYKVNTIQTFAVVNSNLVIITTFKVNNT